MKRSATDLLQPAKESPAASSRSVATGAVVLALTALAYANTFGVPFFFDDLSAIVRNASIRNLWSWHVFTPPLDAAGATGRPLVNLTLALNYASGGTAVRGYHIFNLLVHLASTALLLGFVWRTFLSPAVDARFRAHAKALASVIALLWALHPLQTESVTCTIQRTELLGGFFVLFVLYAFLRATGPSDAVADTPRIPPRIWSLLAVIACFLGVAAKEFVAVVPLLVLLYDRTFVAGTFRAAWHARRLFYLGLASSWLLFAVLLGSAPHRNHNVGFGLGVSGWEYLLTQCRALAIYLKLAIWPHPLVVDYGNVLVERAGDVAVQAVVIGSLLAATFWALARRPVLGFLGAWFFILLGPSSSFIPLTTQTIAEHRMYLPLAAVCTAVVVGTFSRWGRPVFFVGSGVALLFGALTFLRNRDYRTELSLWSDTVAKAPENARAHYDLGNALSRVGRESEAVPQYETALRLSLGRRGSTALSGAVSANLARALVSLGRSEEAVAVYRRGLELDPQSVATRVDLAVTLLALGRAAEAMPLLQEAIQLKPTDVDARAHLAEALLALHRTDEAIAGFQAASQLAPRNSAVRRQFANLLLDQNRLPEAVAVYREILQLPGGEHPEVHTHLAIALSELGQAEAALPHFIRAAEMEPANPAMQTNLGAALLRVGQLGPAKVHLEAALRLNPNYAPAREILAAWPAGASPR